MMTSRVDVTGVRASSSSLGLRTEVSPSPETFDLNMQWIDSTFRSRLVNRSLLAMFNMLFASQCNAKLVSRL